jgi:hypothetical protein
MDPDLTRMRLVKELESFPRSSIRDGAQKRKRPKLFRVMGRQVEQPSPEVCSQLPYLLTRRVGMAPKCYRASVALQPRPVPRGRLLGNDLSSEMAHMLAFLGLALPQRPQSCVREFESPKVEVRSIPCLLARCGYQSGRKRLVPLECKTRHIADDSP